MGAESTSPCTWVKHLPNLLSNRANGEQNPSIYEDRRPKSKEDIEKTDGKGIASGQKGPWDQHGTRATAAPGLVLARPATGLGREPGQGLPPLPNKV